MRRHSEDICPNCHQLLIDGKPAVPTASTERTSEREKQPADDREYDHRGIALPRRTRMGGIITPQ